MKMTTEQRKYLQDYSPLASRNKLSLQTNELWNHNNYSRDDLTWIALELLRMTIEE